MSLKDYSLPHPLSSYNIQIIRNLIAGKLEDCLVRVHGIPRGMHETNPEIMRFGGYLKDEAGLISIMGNARFSINEPLPLLNAASESNEGVTVYGQYSGGAIEIHGLEYHNLSEICDPARTDNKTSSPE